MKTQNLMSVIQSIRRVEYPICKVQGHHEESSLVCLSKYCTQSVLVCPLCEFQLHVGHQTQPLRQFLQQGKACIVQNKLIMKQALKIQEQIESAKINALRELRRIKQEFQIAYLTASSRVELFYNASSNRILAAFQSRTQKFLVSLLSQYNYSHSFSQLERVVMGLKAKASVSLSEQVQLFSKALKGKTDNFTSDLGRLKIVNGIEMLAELFQIPNKEGTAGFFSWKSHPSNIIVKMNSALQTQPCTKSQRFALAEPICNIGKDILIKFRISKLKGWIGVGICLKKAIENSNYFFNDTKTNHGSYLISSNGYCWSHSEPSFNSVAKSFSFKEGDIITIHYSSAGEKVVFSSNFSGAKFALQTQPCGNDKYVPCVNLCQIGDEVEIINDLY